MNLKFIESFVWVAKLQSFRLAAAKSYSTTAAISNRIASLEDTLNTRLFNRTSRSVTLTDDGKIVFEYAELLLNVMNSLRAAVSKREKTLSQLRIGTIDTVMCTWLNDFTNNLVDNGRNTKVEITTDSATNLKDQILKDHIDLALHTEEIDHDAIINQRVASYNMQLVKLKPEKKDVSETSKQLTQLISLPEYQRRLIDYRYSEGGCLTLSTIRQVNSACTILAMVRGGFGIGALPSVLVAGLIKSGELVEIPLDPPLPKMNVVASWNKKTLYFNDNDIINCITQSAQSYESAQATFPA